MTLPKTITKSGPRQNQANYTSFERLLLELYKNVLFIKSEPAIVSKVMGIYVKFLLILPCPLTKYGEVM